MGTIYIIILSKYIMIGVVFYYMNIQNINFATLRLFKKQAFIGNGGTEKWNV